MGNDGGVISTQRKFLSHGHVKAKEEIVDPNEVSRLKTTTCTISNEPLVEPIVACELGKLYNREVILSRLLSKTLHHVGAGHIRKMKDIVTCRFTPNPAFSKSESDAPDSKKKTAMFICPVSLIEFNGKHKFSMLRTCGCVVSSRALREVRINECLVCGQAFTPDDVTLLIPSEQDDNVNKQRMERRREKAKADKKKSKESAKDGASEPLTAEDLEKKADRKRVRKEEKERKKAEAIGQAKAAANAAKRTKRSGAVAEAASVVSEASAKSEVFASLFKPAKKDGAQTGSDLFISVGGQRYTLN